VVILTVANLVSISLLWLTDFNLIGSLSGRITISHSRPQQFERNHEH
jgi:hypothetical protein